MNISFVRKDKLPQKTIKNISKILKSYKIHVKRKSQCRASRHVYSTRIELCGFYNLGTNGKGISKEYALASAMGEFMERLQGEMMIRNSFLLKNRGEQIERINVNENNMAIVSSLLKKSAPDEETYDRLYDFTKSNLYYQILEQAEELTESCYTLLPLHLINMLTHSNGLCAGNTREEAIIQGACEIFERYCYKQILMKNADVDNIDFENELLTEIKKMGYEYYLKDCSLGKFPVVGLLLFNKEKTKYIFSVASDPNFEIAVQRCITEMFQGMKINRIDSKMKSVNTMYDNIGKDELLTNWLKQYSSNDGYLPKNIFSTNLKKVKTPCCFTSMKTTSECYEFVINIIKQNDLLLFCKDLSFLGFKTYKLYIPSLSEIEWPTQHEINCINNKDTLENIVYKIGLSTNEEISYFINSFLPLSATGKYHIMSPGNYFHTDNYIKSDLSNYSFSTFLLMLAIKIGDFDIANKICDCEISSVYNSNKEKTFFLEVKANMKKIKAENKFSLKLPSCPYCSICECRSSCKYNSWKKINKILNKEKQIYTASLIYQQ